MKQTIIGSGIFSGKPVWLVELDKGETLLVHKGQDAGIMQGPGVARVNSWTPPKRRGKELNFYAGSTAIRCWVPGDAQIRIGELTRGWFAHFDRATDFGWLQIKRLPVWDGGVTGKEVYVLYDEGDYGPLLPRGYLACPVFRRSGTTYVVVREGSPKLKG